VTDGRAQDRKVFSNPALVSLGVIGGLFCGAIGLGEMLIDTSIGERVAFGICFLAGVWLAVRASRSGIVVDSGGVEVRGWARTRRATWANVAGFEAIPGSPFSSPINRSVYLAVRLQDGTHLSTGGLGANRPGAYTNKLLAEMEARRPQSADDPAA
jgi:hypothetical protein